MVYSVFGLRVRANRPIPGLKPLSGSSQLPVDLELDLVCPGPPGILQAQSEPLYVSPERETNGKVGLRAWTLAQGAYFRLLYGDGTSFLLNREGTKLWAGWPEPLTLEDTATYLLGPVLAFVMRLRGRFGLHASAVRVGESAIALLGPPGAGKSTTAAALARMGYAVLTDDVTTLVDRGGSFLVLSAHPLLRLWEDSVECLFGSAEALPRFTPTWEKRCLDLTRDEYRFESQPLPLAAIYALGERSNDGAALTVEPLNGNTALMTLVSNTNVSYLLDANMRARELELLGRVAATVPVRKVTPHNDPASLGQLCEIILADFEGLLHPGEPAATVSQPLDV